MAGTTRSVSVVATVAALGWVISMTQAAIVDTGDVSPANPATWPTSFRVYIGESGAGSVTVDDDSDLVSVRSCLGYQFGSTGAVTISGAGSTWTNSESLHVGHYGDGTLEITNGGAVSSKYSIITDQPGSTGAVTVSGTGSTWTSSQHLRVGAYGDSTLDITNNGAVSNTDGEIGFQYGSSGVVTVSGAGSAWTISDELSVGAYGDGTLNIADGGIVAVGKYTHVARYAGATGAINFDNGTLTTGGFRCAASDLSGTGTINTNGLVSDVDLVFDASRGLTQTLTLNGPGRNITVNLNVNGYGAMGAGHRGEGSMHISDGLAVQSTFGYLGYESGSTGAVIVSGAGSTWTNSKEFHVGYYGDGTLEITDGGSVNNEYSYIGRRSGSTGAVTVSGTGATWTNSQSLHVGEYGDGTLEITNGAAVNNEHSYIGRYSDSTGAVTVSGAGSIWTNSWRLNVGEYGDGTLEITDGGSVNNEYSYIGYRSGSTGAVTVSGTGATWTNSSYLHVGKYGDGTLNIYDSGLVSVGGDLTIDDDGDGDSFITMSSGGMLALFGDADDSLTSFLALINGTDDIRYRTGSDWADITGATPGVDYTLTYLTEGELTGYTVLTVPEPATLILMAGGLPLLLKRKRLRLEASSSQERKSRRTSIQNCKID